MLKKETVGKIHSFESFSTLDGPGIRFVVFLQGCFLNCIYCHNPDSWQLNSKKTMTPNQLLEKILEYKDYIKNGGVTISGGEPLLQINFLKEFLALLNKNKIHTAIETSFALPLKEVEEIINLTDLLILDIKALSQKEAEKICKINVKNTIDCLNFCKKQNKDVWVRHVLLPGFSLKEKNLKKIAEFLKQFQNIKRVELLPFHKMGEFKWEELNLPYTLKEVKPPTKEEIKKAELIFKKVGLFVI